MGFEICVLERWFGVFKRIALIKAKNRLAISWRTGEKELIASTENEALEL